jgi:hypothetical protein
VGAALLGGLLTPARADVALPSRPGPPDASRCKASFDEALAKLSKPMRQALDHAILNTSLKIVNGKTTWKVEMTTTGKTASWGASFAMTDQHGEPGAWRTTGDLVTLTATRHYASGTGAIYQNFPGEKGGGEGGQLVFFDAWKRALDRCAEGT